MSTAAPKMVERIEQWPVERLVPYDRNARTHSEAQIGQIAASITQFGFNNPVLIDSSSGIIAGHGRYQAARKLGLTSVPVIVLDHLTDAQRRAYIIADNKLALNAGWDEALLAAELGDIEADFDLSLLGFDDAELEKLLAREDDGRADECPDVPETAVTRRGDLWLLGNHRLLCGDATSSDDVARLMNGRKADMVFTDPPYGMGLDTDFSGMIGSLGRRNGTTGNSYRLVIGDHEDFKPELILKIFEQFDYCKEIFVWGADYYADLLPDRRDGSWLVWDKRKETQSEAIGSEFELCWSRTKHKRRMLRHDWFGFLSSGNSSEARRRVHPTQKPTSLIVDVFKQWGGDNDLVADVFGGSGSTLIACEKTSRDARLMEIDPKYCDVSVKRWQEFTGRTAKLDGDGRTFAEASNERQKQEVRPS